MSSKHDATGRSRRKLSPFIALERYIKASPAWQSLSLAARCTYVELLDLYDGRNNGRLALSARSLADRLPISRATSTRALKELAQRGFVEVVRASGFNVKRGDRRATEWRLTRYHCDVTGAPPTQAFMRWQGDKFHFAGSSQSHFGFSRERLEPATQQNCRKVAL